MKSALVKRREVYVVFVALFVGPALDLGGSSPATAVEENEREAEMFAW